jgi:hypothetical protein
MKVLTRLWETRLERLAYKTENSTFHCRHLTW